VTKDKYSSDLDITLDQKNKIFSFVLLKSEIELNEIYGPEYRTGNLQNDLIDKCLEEHNDLKIRFDYQIAIKNSTNNVDFFTNIEQQIKNLMSEKIESTEILNLEDYLSVAKYVLFDKAEIQSAREGLPSSIFGITEAIGRDNVTKLKPYIKTKIRFADNTVKELYGVPSNWKELETRYPFLKSIRYIVAEMTTNIDQVLIPELNLGRDTNAESYKEKSLNFMNDIIRVHVLNGEELIFKGDKTYVKALIRFNQKEAFKSSGIQYSNTTLMGSSSENSNVEINYSTPYSFIVPRGQRIDKDVLVPIINSVTQHILDLKINISNTNNDYLKSSQDVKFSSQVKFEVSPTFPKVAYDELKTRSQGINENFINSIDKIYNGTDLTFIEKTKEIGNLVKAQKLRVKPLRLASSKIKKYLMSVYIQLGLYDTNEWKKAKNNVSSQNRALSSFRKKIELEHKFLINNPTMLLLIDDIEPFEALNYEDVTKDKFNEIVDIYVKKFEKSNTSINLSNNDLINLIESYFTPISGFKKPDKVIEDRT
jgi:hypothetical protein